MARWQGVSGSRTVAMGTTRQALPTVTGFALKCAVAALRRSDADPDPLLRRAGLTERDLDQPKHRLSATAQADFLEYAAIALHDPLFGLRLAELSNPREVGLLFYVMSAAENVAEALSLLIRYCRIVNESVRLKIVPRLDEIILEPGFFGVSRHRMRQNAEFQFAIVVKSIREMAGRNVCPTRVAFAHGRAAEAREFERFFGCPVDFAATSDQITFSNATLALPLITEDPHLLEMLRPFCEEAARARKTGQGTMRAAVENEIQRLLPHGRARAEVVAKALAVSSRTLARRLAEEGTNFGDLVDSVRRSLAAQYLRESSFTLAQIGWLLGYEGATSFHHAFKRWTGRSPSLARSEPQLLAHG
jgi:AraC-like DNA-binding protein